ncbi:hypothetical protein FQA39_LY00615 [Lamprigera yunnana]|nr:hypothetical protein FQA39_LY00615 [Lamprigera yunnana]
MLALSKVFKRCIGTQDIQKIITNNESGFERVMKKLTIVKAGEGICIGEMKVEEEHTNPMKGLHGGLMATLVDCLTTYALMTNSRSTCVPTVSVQLNMTYMKAAYIGDDIVIKADTVKVGNALGFTECVISNKVTGDILAKGSHTKYFLR